MKIQICLMNLKVMLIFQKAKIMRPILILMKNMKIVKTSMKKIKKN